MINSMAIHINNTSNVIYDYAKPWKEKYFHLIDRTKAAVSVAFNHINFFFNTCKNYICRQIRVITGRENLEKIIENIEELERMDEGIDDDTASIGSTDTDQLIIESARAREELREAMEGAREGLRVNEDDIEDDDTSSIGSTDTDQLIRDTNQLIEESRMLLQQYNIEQQYDIENEETKKTIDKGAKFILNALAGIKNEKIVEFFKETDPFFYIFLLNRSVFIYAMGTKCKEDIPNFFKPETRNLIQNFRNHLRRVFEVNVTEILKEKTERLQQMMDDPNEFTEGLKDDNNVTTYLFDGLRNIAAGELQGGLFPTCYQEARRSLITRESTRNGSNV